MRPPLFSYPPESSFNTTLLPLPHITLSVTHRASFSVQMVCSLLSNSEAFPVEACLFSAILFNFPSFHFFCLKRRNSAAPQSDNIFDPFFSLCHFFLTRKKIASTPMSPLEKQKKGFILLLYFVYLK